MIVPTGLGLTRTPEGHLELKVSQLAVSITVTLNREQIEELRENLGTFLGQPTVLIPNGRVALPH